MFRGVLGAVAARHELEVGGEEAEVFRGVLGAVAARHELAVGGACGCALLALTVACLRPPSATEQLPPIVIPVLTTRFIVARPPLCHDGRCTGVLRRQWRRRWRRRRCSCEAVAESDCPPLRWGALRGGPTRFIVARPLLCHDGCCTGVLRRQWRRRWRRWRQCSCEDVAESVCSPLRWWALRGGRCRGSSGPAAGAVPHATSAPVQQCHAAAFVVHPLTRGHRLRGMGGINKMAARADLY